MKISLLCATLGERPQELARLVHSLNNQEYKDFELIVVSQSNHNLVKETLEHALFFSVHVESSTMGISAARNAGLKFITGDILMLSDDDCWYEKSALKKVSTYFQETTAAVLCFKHKDPVTHSTYKRYSAIPQYNLSYLQLLSLASIDLCFDLRKCRDLIKFDESFGVGAKFPSGEECILLTELKQAGLAINYFPVTLSYHPTKVFRPLSASDRATKAAIFVRLYGRLLGTGVYLLYLVKNMNYL